MRRSTRSRSDYSRAARSPGLPPGQGAGEGRASAVPRSDPARRRPRADPARRRRSAARARRRAGQHARHPRRRRRRGAAAEVHRDVRDGAADRSGRLRELTLRRRKHAHVADAAVEQALSQLRERAARYEPVEGRGIELGDSVVIDLKRTAATARPATPATASRTPIATTTSTVDIGAPANPPGIRRGADRADARASRRPSTSAIRPTTRSRSSRARRWSTRSTSRRSASASCRSSTTSSRRTSGSSIGSTRCGARVRGDLEHEAKHEAEREMRGELLKQLAARVTFDVPASLLDREIDRRVEEFVRRLIEQQIDPMRTNINWEEFRERQRDAASEAVRGALVLDEVARREGDLRQRRRRRRGSRALRRAQRPDRRRRCGRASRRKAGSRGSIPGCGASGRWISCSSRATVIREG